MNMFHNRIHVNSSSFRYQLSIIDILQTKDGRCASDHFLFACCSCGARAASAPARISRSSTVVFIQADGFRTPALDADQSLRLRNYSWTDGAVAFAFDRPRDTGDPMDVAIHPKPVRGTNDNARTTLWSAWWLRTQK